MTLLRFFLAMLALCLPLVASAQQPAKPTFDHRKIIATNLSKMFSADSQVRNVSVSELRSVQSPTGLTWAACVRLNATSMTGAPTATRTYVVTFTMRNDIAERREARAKDCADAQFQPLK